MVIFMETIRQMLQNILIYVMMMAVLKSLVTREGFLEIFRFVSGVILILVCAGSVLSVAVGDNTWYETLEEKIFQKDMTQIQEEMDVSQGYLEQILIQEWEKELKEQIQKIVQAYDEEIEDVSVETEKNEDGELQVKSLSVWIDRQQGKEKKQDKITRTIKKKICSKYDLSNKAVSVWRKNGKSGWNK
jgi:hypothetical protein